jgi:hypothetical protein
MKKFFFLLLLTGNYLVVFSQEPVKVFIDAEGGSVSTGYNDVRVPNKTGSNFSLKDDLNPGNHFFYRLKGGLIINDRHTISFLYAPLSIDANGTFKKEIDFLGIKFPADVGITGNFRLTTYRLTYRYDFIKNSKGELGLGLTAAYREASVRIRSTLLNEHKDDSGFSPLLNVRALWQPHRIIGVLLEGDVLLATKERAEDFLLAANFKFSNHFAWRIGYRILEGGADNSSIYTNSLFNFATTGLTLTF